MIGNRNMTARDIIAEIIHDALTGRESEGEGTLGDGCNHGTGTGSWTGAPNADECVGLAQDILTKLGEKHVHVAEDEAATDGHEHVIMFVDAEARDDLRSFLFEPEQRGVGYSKFITQAIALRRHHDPDSHPGECPIR